MKFRFLLVSVLVALLVILPAAISAQDFDTCFNLAEADCAEIDAATTNLAVFAMSSQSFSIEYALDFSATGMPADMAGAESAAFVSSGAIDVVLSSEAGMLPVTLGAIFESEYGMGDMMTSMPIEVRLVDDFVYFLNPMTGTWQGFNVADEMSDPEFTDQIENMNPLGNAEDIEAMMPDVETLAALTTLLDLPGFIDYTRDGDDFIFTLDLTALASLSEPENAEKLQALVAALNATEEGSGDEIVGMLPMLPMVLQEGTITIVQSINPELEIVDYIGFDVALTVNGEMVGGTEPVVIGLTFEMEVTNVDAAPAALAPAEFEEVDPSELMGGM